MEANITKITDRLGKIEERIQELDDRLNYEFDDVLSSVLDLALEEMRTRAKEVIQEAMNDVQKT